MHQGTHEFGRLFESIDRQKCDACQARVMELGGDLDELQMVTARQLEQVSHRVAGDCAATGDSGDGAHMRHASSSEAGLVTIRTSVAPPISEGTPGHRRSAPAQTSRRRHAWPAVRVPPGFRR